MKIEGGKECRRNKRQLQFSSQGNELLAALSLGHLGRRSGLRLLLLGRSFLGILFRSVGFHYLAVSRAVSPCLVPPGLVVHNRSRLRH